MMNLYILIDKKPVICHDIILWGTFMATKNRILNKTTIGDAEVSTVFLGLDHSFDKNSAPVLYETMVFGGTYNGFQERYCTWDEAERGHEVTCIKVASAQIFEEEIASTKLNEVLEEIGDIEKI